MIWGLDPVLPLLFDKLTLQMYIPDLITESVLNSSL